MDKGDRGQICSSCHKRPNPMLLEYRCSFCGAFLDYLYRMDHDDQSISWNLTIEEIREEYRRVEAVMPPIEGIKPK